MAEVIGLLASIIQVSSFGLHLGRTLKDYGSSVAGVDKRLRGLDKDIDFTSHVISELGSLLKDPRIQALVSERSINLARDAVAECDAIFQAMEDIIANIRRNGMGKWKIYFRESKIGLLRSNLDRMKGNLQLLLQVITSANQLTSDNPSEATMAAHRAKIRELMFEKELYTQKYLQEKCRYDELLTRINSTSTFASVSTTHTGLSDNQPRTLSASMVDDGSQAKLDMPIPPFQQGGSQIEGTMTGRVEMPEQSNLAPQPTSPSTSGIEPGVVPRPPPAAYPPSNVHEVDGNAVENQYVSESNPCSHPQASTLEIKQARTTRFSNSRRNIAKGVKSATTKTLAVALYPISAIMSKRRRARATPDPDSSIAYPRPSFAFGPSCFRSNDIPSNPVQESSMMYHIPYDSTQITAELPGPHEMPQQIPAELSLINELTHPGPH